MELSCAAESAMAEPSDRSPDGPLSNQRCALGDNSNDLLCSPFSKSLLLSIRILSVLDFEDVYAFLFGIYCIENSVVTYSISEYGFQVSRQSLDVWSEVRIAS